MDPPVGEAPDPNYDYQGYLNYREQLEAYEAYRDYAPVHEPLTFDSYDAAYQTCEYLGDGVFQLNFDSFYVLLSVENQSVIYTERWSGSGNEPGSIRAFLTGFEDGAATVLYDDETTDLYGDYRVIGLRSIGSLHTDGTLELNGSNEWVQFYLRENQITFSEGVAFYAPDFAQYAPWPTTDGAYCDYMGNEVVSISEYRGKRSYIGDPFYGGYAALIVYGADNQSYVTVISRDGEIMFEPKAGYHSIHTSEDGKYVTLTESGAVTVLNIHGEPLLRVEYSEIVANSYRDNTVYNVRDGVLRVKDVYVNVESGAVIGLHDSLARNFTVTKY